MPLTLPSPLLILLPPATYNPYAPAGPSRCASNAAPASLPSPLLPLLHPCLIFSATQNPYPQHPQDIPPIPEPHLSTHSSLRLLPFLRFHITSIGYGGSLEYTMKVSTEICLVDLSSNII
ncbi:hypothetical protein O181_079822 [Austropuccinia psidii MF-1]|uniref:Uncharacterized protein n=1 Tax=Austropuccinia psidii MF-1 TaxID=1389203 RepID=A0A9Q3FMT7_9BASI|nr:hypothetical protein [Austropuccinia psidii MF-1]